jgi:quinol monooxygenase YgiN
VSSAIRMRLRWVVPPHELVPVSAALNTLMVAARSQHGWLVCHLMTEVGPRVEFEYVEEWNEEEDLILQVRSQRFARFAELMERATELPQVEFTVPGGTRGLDYAEEVRRGGSA